MPELLRDLRLAQARLAETLGTTTVPEIDARLPDITVIATAEHPQRRTAELATRAADERIDAVRSGYYPRLELAAALWARGSSFRGQTTNVSGFGQVRAVQLRLAASSWTSTSR